MSQQPVNDGKMTQESRTSLIGERLKAVRKRRDLSAQKLADRCNELGFPDIKRDAIVSLEIGRRTRVSVDELLALAYALEVSPAFLMMPPDPRSSVRLIESVEPVRITEAVAWLAGEEPYPGMDPERFYEENVIDSDVAEHPAYRAVRILLANLRIYLVWEKRAADSGEMAHRQIRDVTKVGISAQARKVVEELNDLWPSEGAD